MADLKQASGIKPGGYPKEIFKNGSYNVKFECSFCQNILKEPVQSYCGHRFCKSCLDDSLRSDEGTRCKQCIEEGYSSEDDSIISPDQIFPDNAIRREMSRLQVVCVNTGCKWNGTFKQYEEHYRVCEYESVPCPNCGQIALQKVLQAHLDHHCKKVQVICPDCGKDVLREMLQQHQQTECLVTCPVGCGVIVRTDFQEHFKQMKHEVWIVQAIEKVEHTLNEIQEVEKDISKHTATTLQLNEKIEFLERQVQGLSRQLSECENSTILTGKANIDLKIKQAIELQLQAVNERIDVKTGTMEGIAGALHQGLEKTITEVEKLDRQMREMELQLQYIEEASFDGTFTWKLSDFSKKHQDAVHGRTISIYSPPFYTTRREYKMCAMLYPNGDGTGKGSHLSLFFVLMRGNYDALLKWPFSQRVSFCLINQTGGEHVIDSFIPDPQMSSFKRPTSDMNIASGCPLFIQQEMLQNASHGFLKDDTLFLKIVVDVTELTDPVSNAEERIIPQVLA